MPPEQQLPPALRKQVQAAEALQAQLEQAAANAPATITPLDQIPVAPTPAQPPAATPAAPATQTPTPAPVAPTAPTPPPSPPVTMQDLLDANAALRDEIRRANRPAPAPAPAQPAAPAQVVVPELPKGQEERDEELFGKEVLELVNRKNNEVMHAVRSIVEQLNIRMAALEQGTRSASDTAELSVQQVFTQNLRMLVPDYEAVNAEQGWLKWLQQKDPGYRFNRQAALDAAVQAYDATATAEIFNAYKSTKTPPPVVAQQQNSLESQIQPDTAAPEAPAPAAQKPIFYSSQVQSFYDDWARGKYRGREAEAQRISVAIDEAVAEGRIRKG